MSNTKFTQGPWKVEVNTDLRGNPRSFSIVPAARPGKRNIVAYTPDGTTTEHRANAALLATAPEMYDAVETALECLENNGFARAYIEDLLRNALRKARGEA